MKRKAEEGISKVWFYIINLIIVSLFFERTEKIIIIISLVVMVTKIK